MYVHMTVAVCEDKGHQVCLGLQLQMVVNSLTSVLRIELRSLAREIMSLWFE